jgi:tetratricopeptide (TPR) repeat protein
MKEPTTPDEVWDLHQILRKDPQHYLRIVDDWIHENPRNSHAYYDRHLGWMKIGESLRALDDINKAIEFATPPRASSFAARGDVLRHIGEYEAALQDYRQSDALDPESYCEGFTMLNEADCHARLGDEAAALKCCARLPDDFWTPGPNDAPPGDKAAIAARLKVIAAEARIASNRSEAP